MLKRIIDIFRHCAVTAGMYFVPKHYIEKSFTKELIFFKKFKCHKSLELQSETVDWTHFTGHLLFHANLFEISFNLY